MTSVTDISRRRAAPALGAFERHLTLWVALCIIAGIVLGRLVPAPFQVLGRMTVAEVNIPVAVLIWLMIVPMLLKIDFGALRRVAEQWRGIAVTVGINWLVKPFSMALLGWFFIGWLFRDLLPAGQIDSYIAGLILLAAAPCTAMVFVWSNAPQHREAPVPAVAREADQHRRQAHRERQAARQLDVRPGQQDQRRDQQLAPGHAQERGQDTDRETGGHAGDGLGGAGQEHDARITTSSTA